jgi:integrase
MSIPFNPKTGKWIADYTDQFGKRHRHGFDTKKEAKDHKLEIEAAIRDRTFRPDASKTTVLQVGKKWMEAELLRVKRKEIERTTYENVVAGFVHRYLARDRLLHGPKRSKSTPVYFNYPIGQMFIGDLTEAHVEEFRGAVIDLGYSRATVNNATTALGLMLAWAKLHRYVAVNVARGGRRRRNRGFKPDRPKIPEKETVAQLLKHVSPRHRTLILVAATTGLRTSEQRALQWKHVDLEGRRITVERRVDAHGEIGPPKTEAGYRDIPLSPRVADELAIHKATLKTTARDDLVFPSRSGTPIQHSNLLTNVWRPTWARILSSWEGDVPPQQCGWHGLRHFAISTWIERDVPLKQIQKWAGHATAAMTLDVYGHLFKSADHSRVIDAIADDLFRVGK